MNRAGKKKNQIHRPFLLLLLVFVLISQTKLEEYTRNSNDLRCFVRNVKVFNCFTTAILTTALLRYTFRGSFIVVFVSRLWHTQWNAEAFLNCCQTKSLHWWCWKIVHFGCYYIFFYFLVCRFWFSFFFVSFRLNHSQQRIKRINSLSLLIRFRIICV